MNSFGSFVKETDGVLEFNETISESLKWGLWVGVEDVVYALYPFRGVIKKKIVPNNFTDAETIKSSYIRARWEKGIYNWIRIGVH